MITELNDFRMVEDDFTSYDEVIKDINGLAHFAVECKNTEWQEKTQQLVTQKCKQLRRLLDDDDSQIE